MSGLPAATPRVDTKGFYDLLREEGEVALSMAQSMQALVADFGNVRTTRKTMKELEHRADDIVHRLHEGVNETFVTPLDREDLRELASKLDQVVDMLYATALRLELYDVEGPDEAMSRLADIILQSVEKLAKALTMVGDREAGEEVEALAVEVHKLENVADDVMNEAIASLFKSQDAITVIKLKEIYEKMEQATDYCEDVADTLSDVVSKNR